MACGQGLQHAAEEQVVPKVLRIEHLLQKQVFQGLRIAKQEEKTGSS